MPKRRPLLDRLLESVTVVPETGCWLRSASANARGYTQIREGGTGSRALFAHRVAYELLIGPIPDGFVIDHLCRVRHCVNPAHLEAVTSAENNRRSDSPSARNARKTHCKHGHSLANAYVMGSGKRRCRTCSHLHVKTFKREQRRKQKAQAA